MSRSKADVAAEVWGLVFALFQSRRQVFLALSGEHGLTPATMQSLLSLEPGEGRPMGALAAQWGCDASNVTFTVDRLEERGLAARQADPTDRRVKAVVLTAQGCQVRQDILDQLRRPPAELDLLSVDELDTLAGLLARTGITPDPGGPRWPRAMGDARRP